MLIQEITLSDDSEFTPDELKGLLAIVTAGEQEVAQGQTDIIRIVDERDTDRSSKESF